jgi:hypothetical protein
MDGLLISKLIYTHCPKIAHLFGGCFPCDTFPPLVDGYPQFQIVNTDPHDESGVHWVLVGRRVGGKLFYFDSLDPPKNIPYACVRNRLSSFYGKVLTNDSFLIRPINIGLYCIYAAHVIYLAGSDEDFRGRDNDAWVDEDDILQFAHENFGGHTFVKHALYL